MGVSKSNPEAVEIGKQRGEQKMDVEIRQEYIKWYPPVKELFDLLDKGNPNVYKQMHGYLAAVDKAKILISLLRNQRHKVQFEVEREAVEKLIASVELDYASFNRYAEQYLQLVKEAKEQKDKSTARLREYRERAKAEMYAVDFWIRVSWLSELVLNREYLKYYDCKLGLFCWFGTPKQVSKQYIEETRQSGGYTLYNIPFWGINASNESLYELLRPATPEEIEQEERKELKYLNTIFPVDLTPYQGRRLDKLSEKYGTATEDRKTPLRNIYIYSANSL